MLPLVEIRIDEPKEGEQHLEVWVTTARSEDGGRSSQRVVDIPLKFPVPLKD